MPRPDGPRLEGANAGRLSDPESTLLTARHSVPAKGSGVTIVALPRKDPQQDTPVLRTARFRPVVSDGVAFTIATGRELIRHAFIDEISAHGFGAPLR